MIQRKTTERHLVTLATIQYVVHVQPAQDKIYEEEIGVDLGYGAIGRIAACSIDSLATLNVPCWAYGLRYDYGIFRQEVIDGEQVEIPDYWLEKGNPWEVERPEITYRVRMYGKVTKMPGSPQAGGVERAKWEGGEVVLAQAYDMAITGYNTFNTNNLRLWRSRPYDEYDEDVFIEDQSYLESIEKC